MDRLQENDVPYGDDWDSAAVVADWAKAADQKRPWRSEIRDHIAGIVATLPQRTRVLELGSGPGFLAHQVLDRCPSIKFSPFLDSSRFVTTFLRRLGEEHGTLYDRTRTASGVGDAGFSNVHTELSMNGLVLYAGKKTK